MRISIKKLRHLIRETLYRASAPKRFNLEPIEVDAKNTEKAGDEASKKWFDEEGVRVDPMTVDLKKIELIAHSAWLSDFKSAGFDELYKPVSVAWEKGAWPQFAGYDDKDIHVYLDEFIDKSSNKKWSVAFLGFGGHNPSPAAIRKKADRLYIAHVPHANAEYPRVLKRSLIDPLPGENWYDYMPQMIKAIKRMNVTWKSGPSKPAIDRLLKFLEWESQ